MYRSRSRFWDPQKLDPWYAMTCQMTSAVDAVNSSLAQRFLHGVKSGEKQAFMIITRLRELWIEMAVGLLNTVDVFCQVTGGQSYKHVRGINTIPAGNSLTPISGRLSTRLVRCLHPTMHFSEYSGLCIIAVSASGSATCNIHMACNILRTPESGVNVSGTLYTYRYA